MRGGTKNSPEKGQTYPFVVRLSFFASLLLPFLIPMIIFKRAQDITLGFVVGYGRWDELPQPFSLEGVFLFLVGLFLAHDGFDDIC